MRVLIDHCLPVRIRHEITGHTVETAAYRGWTGLTNGQLIEQAIAEGFDVLLTVDQGVAFQQNLSGRALAVVALPARHGTRLQDLQPLIPRVLEALPKTRRGEVIQIEA